MDPNANLQEQRAIAKEMLAIQDACDDDGNFTEEQTRDLQHLALRLAELVEALDTWITRGGFLPGGWSREINTNGMTVLAVTDDAAYVRLQRALCRDTGGCSCDWCKDHPNEAPLWDTLGIPLQKPKDGRPWTTWTVHAPSVIQLRQGMRKAGKLREPKERD